MTDISAISPHDNILTEWNGSNRLRLRYYIVYLFSLQRFCKDDITHIVTFIRQTDKNNNEDRDRIRWSVHYAT